jgi:hypothetical protein
MLDVRKRMDETPAKMCGGRVLEIGGRDQVVVRGAGVASVLHTFRMAVIAQAGASGIIVEAVMPRGWAANDLRADLDGEPSLLATLTLLFSGVDLEGVFWRPRGVGATFVGDCARVDALVGVILEAPDRDGEPATDPLAERFIPVEMAERDLSRYA